MYASHTQPLTQQLHDKILARLYQLICIGLKLPLDTFAEVHDYNRGATGILRYMKYSPFTEEHAIPLDKLTTGEDKAPAPPELLLPVATALADIPALAVQPDEAAALRQGQAISLVELMGRIPDAADPDGGLARAALPLGPKDKDHHLLESLPTFEFLIIFLLRLLPFCPRAGLFFASLDG